MMQRILAILLFAIAIAAHAQSDSGFDKNTITPRDIPKNAPRFEDYPAEDIYAGQPVPPDVRTHPLSRLFRTAIREDAKSGPNFAGHYTVVGWGCGSGCAHYAIVDARSGTLFHPKNFGSVHNNNIDPALEKPEGTLVKYRLNSKLLIVIGSINEDPALRGVSYFVWDNDRLKRIRFVHKPYR